MPPFALAKTEPFVPGQEGCVEEVVAVNAVGCPTVADVMARQEAASVTVTVYVPTEIAVRFWLVTPPPQLNA